MEMTEDMKGLLVREKGWRGERGYDEFFSEVQRWRHCVSMIWLEVEKTDGLFVVFSAGQDADKAFLDLMKEVENEINYGSSFEGVGAVVAWDKNDLGLENMLQKNKLIYTQRMEGDYDYYLDMPKFELIYPKDEEFRNNRLVLTGNKFDGKIQETVNQMRIDNENKYILTTMKDSKVLLNEFGELDFYNLRMKLLELGNDIPRIMFYKFEYENKSQVVCFFICKVMKLSNKQLKTLEELKKSLSEVAITLYPIMDSNFFDLDVLINVGAIPDPEYRIHINNDLIE